MGSRQALTAAAAAVAAVDVATAATAAAAVAAAEIFFGPPLAVFKRCLMLVYAAKSASNQQQQKFSLVRRWQFSKDALCWCTQQNQHQISSSRNFLWSAVGSFQKMPYVGVRSKISIKLAAAEIFFGPPLAVFKRCLMLVYAAKSASN